MLTLTPPKAALHLHSPLRAEHVLKARSSALSDLSCHLKRIDIAQIQILGITCSYLIAMAEIFGAVASGAGLVSLAMQLLDSAQKLKGFYNLSRDAPDTVRQLCFELETMSMALHQFEQYRQSDIFGSELLSRCIIACDQAVTKIKTSVDKIDRLLSKARFAGKLYMGFKEPEIKKLLEEMEHAKSSLMLAYNSYYQ